MIQVCFGALLFVELYNNMIGFNNRMRNEGRGGRNIDVGNSLGRKLTRKNLNPRKSELEKQISIL